MKPKSLQPIVESYNVEEEHFYEKTYLFVKGYATGRAFENTLKALPLARKIHDGQYRKNTELTSGDKIPYILHPLKVCSTLMSLNLPLSDDELDILYACAILHDTLEDGKEYFPKGGREYVTEYKFDPRVEEIIKLLSKDAGSDEYTLNRYFNAIKVNKIALLIKIADRSHNVEDLYTFTPDKMLKYVTETKEYFLSKNSLCAYAKANYPELSNGIVILKSKIMSLTDLTEVVLIKYREILDEQDAEIKRLKEKLNEA